MVCRVEMDALGLTNLRNRERERERERESGREQRKINSQSTSLQGNILGLWFFSVSSNVYRVAFVCI
jgi:hypothetical protein